MFQIYFISLKKNESFIARLLNRLDNLNNILVMKNMILANPLWLMLHAATPDQGILQLLCDCSVNLVAKVLHWGLVIGKLTLWLGVDPHQLQVRPHLFQQVIVVPLVVSGYRNSVGNFADDIKFFNTDLINLVEEVDARDVRPVALNNIDELVSSCVTA